MVVVKIKNIITEFENKGPEHAPKWIAKNPKILDNMNQLLIPLKKGIKSSECKTKKEAEQEIYLKILKILKKLKK